MANSEKNYKAAIFDLDGTLLFTIEDIRDSVNHTMEAHGFPLRTTEQVMHDVGNAARRLMILSLPEGEETPHFDDILHEYEQWYENHCQIKTRPYDGILPMLERLREAGIHTAIVSNKGDGAVQNLTRQYFTGAGATSTDAQAGAVNSADAAAPASGQLVEEAVGEKPGIRRKPNPDAVLEAMRLLGVTKEETLYVGDSEVDIATARAAGVDVASVTWGYRSRDLLESLAPVYLIDTPEQLLSILVKN